MGGLIHPFYLMKSYKKTTKTVSLVLKKHLTARDIALQFSRKITQKSLPKSSFLCKHWRKNKHNQKNWSGLDLKKHEVSYFRFRGKMTKKHWSKRPHRRSTASPPRNARPTSPPVASKVGESHPKWPKSWQMWGRDARWAPDPVINGVITPINGLIIG